MLFDLNLVRLGESFRASLHSNADHTGRSSEHSAHWVQQTAIDEACADGSPAGAGPRLYHEHKLPGLQYKQAKQRQKKGRKHLASREATVDIGRYQWDNKMPLLRQRHQPCTG